MGSESAAIAVDGAPRLMFEQKEFDLKNWSVTKIKMTLVSAALVEKVYLTRFIKLSRLG